MLISPAHRFLLLQLRILHCQRGFGNALVWAGCVCWGWGDDEAHPVPAKKGQGHRDVDRMLPIRTLLFDCPLSLILLVSLE